MSKSHLSSSIFGNHLERDHGQSLTSLERLRKDRTKLSQWSKLLSKQVEESDIKDNQKPVTSFDQDEDTANEEHNNTSSISLSEYEINKSKYLNTSLDTEALPNKQYQILWMENTKLREALEKLKTQSNELQHQVNFLNEDMENQKTLANEKIEKLLIDRERIATKKNFLQEKMLEASGQRVLHNDLRDSETYEGCKSFMHKMQKRYDVITEHLQEINEQKSSFADGMREKQTQLDNLTALYQMKNETIIKQNFEINEMKSRFNLLENELQLNMRNNKNLENELIEDRKRINDLNSSLNEEKKSHEQTTNQLQISISDCKQKDQDILDLQAEIEVLEPYKAKSEHLTILIDDLSKKYELQTLELESANKNFERSVEEQISQAINHKSDKTNTISLLNEKIIELEDSVKNLSGTLQEQKSNFESKLKDKDSTIDKQSKDIESSKQKLRNCRENLRAYYMSQGKLATSPMTSELKLLKKGTILNKFNFRDIKHRPSRKFMKLENTEKIMWTDDPTGKHGWNKSKIIVLKDIIRIDYGLHSRPAIWLSSKDLHTALNCFSIFTESRSYDFQAPDENTTMAWVTGIGRLISDHTTAPNIQNRTEFYTLRAKWKLQEYSKKRKLPLSIIWKEAIRRYIAQKPALLNTTIENKNIIISERGNSPKPSQTSKSMTEKNSSKADISKSQPVDKKIIEIPKNKIENRQLLKDSKQVSENIEKANPETPHNIDKYNIKIPLTKKDPKNSNNRKAIEVKRHTEKNTVGAEKGKNEGQKNFPDKKEATPSNQYMQEVPNVANKELLSSISHENIFDYKRDKIN